MATSRQSKEKMLAAALGARAWSPALQMRPECLKRPASNAAEWECAFHPGTMTWREKYFRSSLQIISGVCATLR